MLYDGTTHQTAAPEAGRDWTERLWPGTVIGRWQIAEELGRGGMGTVYAAEHVMTGQRGALKIVHLALLRHAGTVPRFLQEVRILDRLRHPHIVDILDSGTLAEGRPYLVMERLDGDTLGQYVRRGPVPRPVVIAILLQVCDALVASHAAGVIHRDLKLDNIFLIPTPTGPHVKLIDWGIARILSSNQRHTGVDMLVGTPRYLAPEQARGEEGTAATDIYSLGVVAYELLLHQLPFAAPSAVELLAMHLHDPPPPPRTLWPSIPRVLERLLLAMLTKAPTRRPAIAMVRRSLEWCGARSRCRANALRRHHRRPGKRRPGKRRPASPRDGRVYRRSYRRSTTRTTRITAVPYPAMTSTLPSVKSPTCGLARLAAA